jgi:hypothetical protein
MDHHAAMEQTENTRTDLAVRLARYRNGVKTELVAIRAALDDLAKDVRKLVAAKSTYPTLKDDRDE